MSTLFLNDSKDLSEELLRLAQELKNDYDTFMLRAASAELKFFKSRYNELVYQVGQITDGENRHDTALRYIREAEEPATTRAAQEMTISAHKLKLMNDIERAAVTANALGYDDWDANK